MKNYNFRAIFQNLNENFAIFTIFFKIYRIFRENLRTNQNYAVVEGSGGGAPRTRRKFQRILLKNH